MLTKVEWVCIGIALVCSIPALYRIWQVFISRYLIERGERKKVKVLNASSGDLIDILNWSEEDDEELRKDLELSGYSKELIKRVFDKKDMKALDELIEVVDKRIKKNEKK